MALLPDVFVPEDESGVVFETLEEGWYLAEITKSILKTTQDKKGKYIAMTFKGLEGDAEDRLLYTNLNIVNNSKIAVRIARADLKGICDAVGFEGELEDTEDLHNIPMWVKVSVKPATSQWPAKNELKAFKSEAAYAEMED